MEVPYLVHAFSLARSYVVIIVANITVNRVLGLWKSLNPPRGTEHYIAYIAIIILYLKNTVQNTFTDSVSSWPFLSEHKGAQIYSSHPLHIKICRVTISGHLGRVICSIFKVRHL